MSGTADERTRAAAKQAAETAHRKQALARQAGLEYALKVPGIVPDTVLSMAKAITEFLTGGDTEEAPE